MPSAVSRIRPTALSMSTPNIGRIACIAVHGKKRLAATWISMTHSSTVPLSVANTNRPASQTVPSRKMSHWLSLSRSARRRRPWRTYQSERA